MEAAKRTFSLGEQPGSLPALRFIEAYFSNWIEGTEFALREAEKIVFRRAVPEGRLEDAHDVLGTYDLVSNLEKRQQAPTGQEDRWMRVVVDFSADPARVVTVTIQRYEPRGKP